jgi:hypothetical protein
MKFVNLSAEAYIDTPSSSWQKHKIAVISVKNGDFLTIFVVILPAVIIVDESLNNNKIAFKSIKPCAFIHFFDSLILTCLMQVRINNYDIRLHF